MMRVLLPIFACAALAGCCGKCAQKKSSQHDVAYDAPPPPPEAEVTVVAREVDYPLGLAVDDEFVYWGHGPILRKAPIKGGPAEEVCKVEAIRINSIVVTEKHLFFGAMGGGVFRMSRGGTKPRRIGTSENPTTLVVDDRTVYWWDQRIRQSPVDAPGDASPPAMVTAGYPGMLVADDTHLYWHDGSMIWRRAKEAEAGEAQALAATGHMDVTLAVDDTHLYWGDDTVGAVLRMPKEGGTAEFFCSEWSFGATLALDDEWVYIATIDTHIYKVAKDDGRKARLVLTAVSGINRNGLTLVADDHRLYLAVDEFLWKTSGGIAHIDLTGKGETNIEGVDVRGSVVHLPKDVEGITYEPRPAMVHLADVYFYSDSDKPQDIGNATNWLKWKNDSVGQAIRSGKLPLKVIGQVKEATGDESLARSRAEKVVAALRENLGESINVEILIRFKESSTVIIETDPTAYAELWNLSKPPEDSPGTPAQK